MKNTDVFYQAEGVADIQHAEVQADRDFGDLKREICKRHQLQGETLIFLEDGDEPIREAAKLRDHIGRAGLKVHVHRCREVEVQVTFNGETVRHRFAPGSTVARVKKWAAEKKFGMTPQEASEHVLQLSGTQQRPDPNVHIGRLTDCPKCLVTFDLVPNERVNGNSGA